MTPVFLSLGLTPNQVTLLGLAAGLFSALWFVRGEPTGWLIGALLFEMAYLLDNCDGEIARITGRSSGLGSWLDTVTDCLIHVGFFLGLGVGLSRSTANNLWLKLGLIATVGVFMTYAAFITEQVLKRGKEAWVHPDPPTGQGSSGFWGQLRKIFREDFSLIVIGSVLVHQMTWLLWGGILGSFYFCFSSLIAIVLHRFRPVAGCGRDASEVES